MASHDTAFLGVPLPIHHVAVSKKSPQCLKRPSISRSCFILGRRARNSYHVQVNYLIRNQVIYCSASEWESLTVDAFNDKIQSNCLPLCLVGMSNCGKSHWSTQLMLHRNFHRICVDDLIEQAIKPELSKLSYSGIDGMAKWMGFPSDEQFNARQNRYLMHEGRITSSAIPKANANTVLDTTGSVIYLNDSTLERLKNDYLVIHLKATDDMLEGLTQNFFETPKPVVWGDTFHREEHETPMDAIRRCYPILLRDRRERYAELAHITIPATFSLSREVDLEEFLEYLCKQLH
ncbi:hypothetical protein BWQ96_06679 [Gracilariopsis chorda]|uniref:Uncharacterized protein n=1 Tax=Gracilariopsis chorda TaxID=448386 RepID=A0A2V3INC6_9FLOR|nr:hypothetical protein BWQ96_06679 [Gracilariopsis chorda]|eukprot:PXF43567.1 hypothetical protein BWQ96_06679 [Gracilariopsis chorda]